MKEIRCSSKLTGLTLNTSFSFVWRATQERIPIDLVSFKHQGIFPFVQIHPYTVDRPALASDDDWHACERVFTSRKIYRFKFEKSSHH